MKLQAADVSFAYGRRAVLRELDCTFPEGRITAIVGANASGKSTLLRAMARLVRPQSGAISSSGDHDVVSRGKKRFRSSAIKSGGVHRYRFKKTGVYTYVCSLHEDDGMTGQITVR